MAPAPAGSWPRKKIDPGPGGAMAPKKYFDPGPVGVGRGFGPAGAKRGLAPFGPGPGKTLVIARNTYVLNPNKKTI